MWFSVVVFGVWLGFVWVLFWCGILGRNFYVCCCIGCCFDGIWIIGYLCFFVFFLWLLWYSILFFFIFVLCFEFFYVGIDLGFWVFGIWWFLYIFFGCIGEEVCCCYDCGYVEVRNIVLDGYCDGRIGLGWVREYWVFVDVKIL